MSSLEPTPLQDVKRKAWRSSELALDDQADAAKKIEPLPGGAQLIPPRIQEPVHSHPPRLHVHSSSVPAWTQLSESDPALDLIRAIKEELKKFDQPSPH